MFPWNFSPYNKETMKMLKEIRPDQIEKYVQNIMENVFQQQMGNMKSGHGANQINHPFTIGENTHHQDFQYSLFETHHFVFILLPIADDNQLKNIKLYHTSNQLIIEHFPEEGDKKKIILPSLISKRGAKAIFKDGTLEIKLHKSMDNQYIEIGIEEF